MHPPRGSFQLEISFSPKDAVDFEVAKSADERRSPDFVLGQIWRMQLFVRVGGEFQAYDAPVVTTGVVWPYSN